VSSPSCNRTSPDPLAREAALPPASPVPPCLQVAADRPRAHRLTARWAGRPPFATETSNRAAVLCPCGDSWLCTAAIKLADTFDAECIAAMVAWRATKIRPKPKSGQARCRACAVGVFAESNRPRRSAGLHSQANCVRAVCWCLRHLMQQTRMTGQQHNTADINGNSFIM